MSPRSPLLLLILLALPALASALERDGLPEGELGALVLPATAAEPLAVGVWPGEPFPGTLLVVDVAVAGGGRAPEGELLGRELRWHELPGGIWRGLAPVADDAKTGPATLRLAIRRARGGRLTRTIPLVVRPVDFDQDRLSVDSKFTKLPQAALKKIRADRAAIAAMWRKGSAAAPWFRENFVLPRDDRFTAPYGTRRVFNGATKSVHQGLDIDGDVDEPVRAPNDGVVTMASELYYSGGTIFVDHGGGLYTGYFHLSELGVKVGDRVKKGQLLGKVGKSGRVTGPHLHWAAKIGGRYVHPATLLRFDFSKPLVEAPEALVAGGAEDGREVVPAAAPR